MLFNLIDALDTVAAYNRGGVACSLSYLPSHKTTRRGVQSDILRYARILQGIRKRELDCDITIKTQQIGIYGSEELAKESLERVVRDAAEGDIFVWLDMEQPDTVDATIRMFESVMDKYRNLGICLQAYLQRTEFDLQRLLSKRAPIRLVKGFYRKHDIESWDDVTRNYEQLMDDVLLGSDYPAIATHDVDLIRRARDLVRERGIRRAEFQFFQGVRDDLAYELAHDGFRVRVYVPYGNVWRFLVDGIGTFDLWRHAQRVAGLQPR